MPLLSEMGCGFCGKSVRMVCSGSPLPRSLSCNAKLLPRHQNGDILNPFFVWCVHICVSASVLVCIFCCAIVCVCMSLCVRALFLPRPPSLQRTLAWKFEILVAWKSWWSGSPPTVLTFKSFPCASCATCPLMVRIVSSIFFG